MSEPTLLRPFSEVWHEEACKFLEEFNAKIREGEPRIVAIGIVTVDARGEVRTTYDHKGQGFELIAAVEFLKRRLMDDILGEGGGS